MQPISSGNLKDICGGVGLENKDVAAQSIVQGIIDTLRDEFGPGYTYYADNIPQNFSEPSFFVRQVNGSMELVCGRRYYRRGLYMVTYFSADRDRPEREMNDVSDRLYPVLEYIDMAGHKIRGTQMEHHTEDMELHFSVHYDIFLLRPPERAPFMRTLTQTIKLKEQ